MRSMGWAVLFSLGLLVGCGGGGGRDPIVNVQPVSGKVQLDGKPGVGITVTFVPADGAGATAAPASGTTNDAGEFSLGTSDGQKGVPTGKYRVLFTKILKADGTPLGPEEMAADVGADNVLPARYNNPTETPIGADVPDGGKSFEFDLKSK